MVLCVDIVAIGPFRRDLVDYYDYPAGRYRNVQDGAPIIRTLFGIVEGTSAGTDFARAMGISDPWDFNQHKINPATIDLVEAERVLAKLHTWHAYDDYQKSLAALRAFIDANYEFYFRPNG